MISNGEIREVIRVEFGKAFQAKVISVKESEFLDLATKAVWALLEHHETQEQIEPMEITVTVKKRGKHLVTATHTLDTLAPRNDY